MVASCTPRYLDDDDSGFFDAVRAFYFVPAPQDDGNGHWADEGTRTVPAEKLSATMTTTPLV